MAAVTTLARLQIALALTADELAGGVQEVKQEFGRLAGDVEQSLGTVKSKVSDELGGIASKIGPAVGIGIAGVTGLLSGTFQEAAKLAVNVFGDTLQGALVGLGVDPELATNIQRFAENFTDLVTGPLIEGVSGGIEKIGGVLAEKVAGSSVIEALSPVFGAIGTAVGTVMDAAIALAPLALPALLIAAIGVAIVAIVNDPSLLQKAADIGIGIVTGIVNGVLGIAGGAISLAVQLGTAVVNAVGSVITGAIGLLGKAAELGGQIVTGIINGVLGLATGAVSFAVQLGQAVIGGITDLATGVVQGVGTVADAAIKIGGSIIGGIIDGMAGLADQLFNTIYNAIADALGRGITIGPFHIDSHGASLNVNLPGIDVPHFATGAWEIPNDTLAVVHRGEMVVPAAVAAGLRAGAGAQSQIAPLTNARQVGDVFLNGERVGQFVLRYLGGSAGIYTPTPVSTGSTQ